MPGEPHQLTDLVLERCDALGFAASGVCPAAPSEQVPSLRQWLDEGAHASMAWMEQHVELRTDVRLLLEGARSVIMVADLYASRGSVDESVLGVGRVARYARGRDYHKVLKKRLHQLCDELKANHADAQFRTFVDTAPVLERELAARCGIGWQGKHTLIIHPKIGSWFLLGGIVTTLDLPVPVTQPVVVDHCGTCTRCIDACPTEAITPHHVDARRCISYLTIEHREPIDSKYHHKMGDWIFGCDICQEVCPHNSGRFGSELPEPNVAYAPGANGFELLDVLEWTEEDRRQNFEGSSMKRAKLDMMRRNAAIAAHNALADEERPILRATLTEIAKNESEPTMVRDAAKGA